MELESEPGGEDATRRATSLPSRRTFLVMLPVLALLLVVVALLIVLVARPGGLGGVEAAVTPTATPTPTPTVPTIPQVYSHVGPSVVVIQTDSALGTGVIASDDGTILTANHVVAGARTITVTFADGTKTHATVATSDPKHDIATLSPASMPQILVPATLGGAATVGASVVAIGNPLGLTYSVSSGIIAGTNRTADTDSGGFSGLIQFDAAVNPGSSGGPLLDASGDVMGIVVSIADPGHDDAWSGIGFAVPIGDALGDTGPGRRPQL
jgi:putative serine protease PepD